MAYIGKVQMVNTVMASPKRLCDNFGAMVLGRIYCVLTSYCYCYCTGCADFRRIHAENSYFETV